MHAFTSRALLAAAALAAAAVANAAYYGYDFQVTPSGNLVTTNWLNGETPSHNAVVNGARFDSTLGTLTSVSLSFTWTGTIGGTFKNLSSLENDYDGTYKLDFALKDGSTTLDSFNGITTHFHGEHVAAVTSPPTAITLPTASLGGTRYFDTSNATVMNDLFLGSGKIGLVVTATGSGSLTTHGNNNAVVLTKAGMIGHLNYNYTPQAVPEPASMAALGLGALGLLRRRNAKRGVR